MAATVVTLPQQSTNSPVCLIFFRYNAGKVLNFVFSGGAMRSFSKELRKYVTFILNLEPAVLQMNHYHLFGSPITPCKAYSLRAVSYLACWNSNGIISCQHLRVTMRLVYCRTITRSGWRLVHYLAKIGQSSRLTSVLRHLWRRHEGTSNVASHHPSQSCNNLHTKMAPLSSALYNIPARKNSRH